MSIALRRAKLLLTVLLLVLLPSIAAAEIGPALTGLTGSATDATAAFYSPAGITRLDRPELVVQTIFAYTDSKFSVDNATYAGGDGDNDQSLAVIPGLFYSHPLPKRLHLGLSISVPSGIGDDYGGSWSGRYLSKSSTLAFVAASAVLAYEVTDSLSLAAGPYLMYVDSVTKTRVNNLLPGHPDGSVKLEEDGTDFGYTLGAMYQFTDSSRIATTYRSELKPDLEGTPTFSGLDPLLREALAAKNLLGTEVDVDFTVPQQLQVGFYTEFSDKWSMTGDLIWIDMSEFGVTHINVEQDNISVAPQFQDMVVTNAGLKYRYGEDRAISIGGLYASSPVKDSKRVLGLPFDRIIGGGVGLDMPILDYFCHFNLNYFDLGDGDINHTGDPLTGNLEGSFDRNFAVMFDIQFRKLF